jgi:hypothetical protein
MAWINPGPGPTTLLTGFRCVYFRSPHDEIRPGYRPKVQSMTLIALNRAVLVFTRTTNHSAFDVILRKFRRSDWLHYLTTATERGD